MAWNCINCESANDYDRDVCDVCGYERYFSISEVRDILEHQQGEPSELKKLQANNKRATTVNKKLRKENKELQEQMEALQEFYNNYKDNVNTLEEENHLVRRSNLRLKIWLFIAALVVIFFTLARVSVQIIT